GILFGLWVWFDRGAASGLEFYTGFLIEQSLSMGNVFVMAMILGFFGIPRIYQHRVLCWGILGVIILRAIMIGLGAALVPEFEWMLYICGVFRLFSGVNMFFSKDHAEHQDFSQNAVVR